MGFPRVSLDTEMASYILKSCLAASGIKITMRLVLKLRIAGERVISNWNMPLVARCTLSMLENTLTKKTCISIQVWPAMMPRKGYSSQKTISTKSKDYNSLKKVLVCLWMQKLSLSQNLQCKNYSLSVFSSYLS